MGINKFFLFFFGLTFPNLLLTQSVSPLFQLGGAGSLKLNVHFADFNKLSGIPNCCPKYGTTIGLGWDFSLLFRKGLSEKWDFGLRAGIGSDGVVFNEKEFIGHTNVRLVNDPKNIEIMPVYVDHELKANLFGLNVQPEIHYNFYDNFWVKGGLNFTYFLVSKIDQKETITSPEGVYFLDGKKTRNEHSNIEIPLVKKFQIRPVLGISYDFEILQDFFLSPEFNFALPLQNITNVSWKISNINFALAFRVPIYPPPVVNYYYDTLLVRDTSTVPVLGLKQSRIELVEAKILGTKKNKVEDGFLYETTILEKYIKQVPQVSLIQLSLKVVGRSRDGTTQDNPTLIIDEIETEEKFPLLPYVFFQTGKSDLAFTSQKLLEKEEVDKFDENSLPWNTLKIYENLLNIVGKRLKDNPSARITLVGCNSNTGEEEKNLELSRRRAEKVRDYFVNIWNVNPNQIQIKYQNLPDKFTNPNIPDGIEENQRVEIYSNDLKILAPIYLSQIQRFANPPFVDIRADVYSDSPIKGWTISIEQAGQILRNYFGSDFRNQVVWDVEQEPIPRLEEPIEVIFSATDILDQKEVDKVQLKIEQKTIRKKREEMLGDKKIERYSLIVFDFDKADILPAHVPILNEIKKKIKPNSNVVILGYTDRIGEPSYNKDLAFKRCLAVQKYLGIPEFQTKLIPIGNEELIFDNNLPQGRSYSRTVQIIIETPVK
ncbi:MAG: OmpA family protein [Ignavibacteria bacterium]|nr:OmpA family protein [Ignavibacteria bacterium]